MSNNSNKLILTLVVLAIIFSIWFVIPVPVGVKPEAWHLLAIFIGTILAIIFKIMPIGALALIAITLVAITGVTNPKPSLAIKDALSGLSNSLIWLIGVAIMISRGIIKTGLGRRIGYLFIALFGKKSLGVGYALVLSELVISPVTPSNSARGGAVIHPIMRSIADSFDSDPAKGTEKKIGRFLALVSYHANPITAALFITATTPNVLIAKMITDNTSLHMTWLAWAAAAIVPGLVALLVMPLVIYLIYPPEIKNTPNAKKFAQDKLAELGPMSGAEKIMVGVFLLLLVCWAGLPALILGSHFALNATTVAFLGLSILLVTNVLSWNDVLSEKSAWDTVMWFSALVMMASFLGKLGLITWFSHAVESNIKQLGLGWVGAAMLIVVIYFYAHYFFASAMAHVTAMYAAFFAAGVALGAPPILLALLLAFSSSFMMSLTHYATGTSPIVFGSGYTTLGEWWIAGFVMSIVNLLILVVVGGIWWKILGYW